MNTSRTQGSWRLPVMRPLNPEEVEIPGHRRPDVGDIGQPDNFGFVPGGLGFHRWKPVVGYFCSDRSTARKAVWGISTLPTVFIRFFPSFCFSSSFRLRLISPP